MLSNRTASFLYDYQSGVHYSFGGTITNNRVNVFDYSTSNYVTGNGSSGKFNLYVFAGGQHISLSVNNNGAGRFKGYDYGHGVHFNGKVDKQGNVSFYDYGSGQYYNFKI